MTTRLTRALARLTLFAAAASAPAWSQEPLPSLYVDRGACPFECCTYRTWQVTHRADILAEPRPGARVVTTVRPGDSVVALTGEVRTRPVPFIVHGPFEGDRPPRYPLGDTLWVLTYLGEGAFRVWWRGKIFEEDLGFSPYGGTAGRRCENCRHGRLAREHRSDWWIQLRTAAGLVGWTRESDHFTGADACG